VNDADVLFVVDPSSGPMVIVVSGATVSTLHERVAGNPSVSTLERTGGDGDGDAGWLSQLRSN
jgi:hypothetical protein